MKNFPRLSLKPWTLLLALGSLSSAIAGVNFFDPTNPAAIPQTLAATGIYKNVSGGVIVDKTLDTALNYFEVNAALWSDNAHKDRWVILPPGKSITYVDTTDTFAYPESTIFVKLFRHDTITNDSNSRVYWETRLLVKKTDTSLSTGRNWYGFSYRWNAAGTNATLVDRENGFDTVIYLGQAPRYRKWHFPSQENCNQCHRGSMARSVLGFWPAQLKRPSPLNPGVNQVIALFDSGVFTGTRPTSTLGKRFRGMGEPIPSGLSAEERFKVIDTMARSYIAANCSGCHGTKGLEDGATDRCTSLNYDFYNFQPQMEFGYLGTSGFSLDIPETALPYADSIAPDGRYQMLLTLKEWGLTGFDISRPGPTTYPALVVPGFPTYSTVVFRQMARKSPAADSGNLYRKLYYEAGGDPGNWKAWIFKAQWGSKAWRDSLTAHGVSMAQALLGPDAYMNDPAQMPPLATYIPDTAALKILGEWAKNYRTLYPVDGTPPVSKLQDARIAGGTPTIRNRMLLVPEGWNGRAVMTGLDGRGYPLASVGRGRYALPAAAPSGVYFFRVGNRNFRASVLR